METIVEMLNGPTAHAMGWTLLNSLWQGALCYLLGIAILRSIPTKRSEARYAASVAVMSLMLISSAITFIVVYTPEVSAVSKTAFVTSPVAYSQTVIAPVATSSLQAIISRMSEVVGRQMGLVSAIWLIGAVAFMLRIISGYWYIGFIRRSAQPLGSSWQDQVNELAGKLNIDRFVEVAQSGLINTPMVLGYIKPVIMVPVGMFSGLTTDQLEAIFVHELMHIRRRDYVVNLIQTILEAIYFFNPFAWILSANIRREREHCCDDGVVMNQGNAIAYVRALAMLEEVRLSRTGVALSLAEDKNQLLHRIKRIMEKSVHNYSSRDRFVPAILLVIGLMCASWLTIQSRDRKAAILESDKIQEAGIALVSNGDTTVKQKSGAYYHYSVTTVDKDGKEDTHVVEGYSENGDPRDAVAGMPNMPDLDPIAPIAPVEPIEPIIVQMDQFTSPVMVPSVPIGPGPVVAYIPQPLVPMQFEMPVPPAFNMAFFDTIPSMHNGSWEEFSHEFEETFKERFEDFYKEHESDMKQMMKEFEDRFDDESFRRMGEAEFRKEEARVREREWSRAAIDLARRGDDMHLQSLKIDEARHGADLARVQAKIDRARMVELKDLDNEMKRLDQSLKEMERRLQESQVKVQKEAIRDGYLKKDEKINSININNDSMEINGKKIKSSDAKRYREIMDAGDLHHPHRD
ncbi:M56 family metallopeptidase [Chryseolinea sp. T2]|uniref:M56 family metallopeptidase n=1 Tax=Chryseolinea sp. T2 TaxID=3129255 RepID=UPI0030772815